MNTADILLSLDKGTLKRPIKEYAVKSLSELAKQTIIFKYKGLNTEQFNYVRDNAVSYTGKGNVASVDKGLMAKFGIIEGVIDPNLKDKNLLEHYKCATPLDLLEVLMLPGEIIDLFEKISIETGFVGVEEKVKDIKN